MRLHCILACTGQHWTLEPVSSSCPVPHGKLAGLNPSKVYDLYMEAAMEGWIGLNDHSKWAISSSAVSTSAQPPLTARPKDANGAALASPRAQVAGSHVVCLGDMNREYSQVR